MIADLIIYQISRSRSEVGDCSHLLQQFDIDKLTVDGTLRRYLGRVVFCIEGYDASADELYSIPEVRSFLRAWRYRWPYLLFFGSIENDNLKVLHLGLLDQRESLSGNNGPCRTRFDAGALADLLAADITHADALCVKLGISPAQRLRRTTAILRYFGVAGGVA